MGGGRSIVDKVGYGIVDGSVIDRAAGAVDRADIIHDHRGDLGHVVAVVIAVAVGRRVVGAGLERIEAGCVSDFPEVAQSVAIGVPKDRAGALDVFFVIGQAVTVEVARIGLGVAREERIEGFGDIFPRDEGAFIFRMLQIELAAGEALELVVAVDVAHIRIVPEIIFVAVRQAVFIGVVRGGIGGTLGAPCGQHSGTAQGIPRSHFQRAVVGRSIGNDIGQPHIGGDASHVGGAVVEAVAITADFQLGGEGVDRLGPPAGKPREEFLIGILVGRQVVLVLVIGGEIGEVVHGIERAVRVDAEAVLHDGHIGDAVLVDIAAVVGGAPFLGEDGFQHGLHIAAVIGLGGGQRNLAHRGREAVALGRDAAADLADHAAAVGGGGDEPGVEEGILVGDGAGVGRGAGRDEGSDGAVFGVVVAVDVDRDVALARDVAIIGDAHAGVAGLVAVAVEVGHVARTHVPVDLEPAGAGEGAVGPHVARTETGGGGVVLAQSRSAGAGGGAVRQGGERLGRGHLVIPLAGEGADARIGVLVFHRHLDRLGAGGLELGRIRLNGGSGEVEDVFRAGADVGGPPRYLHAGRGQVGRNVIDGEGNRLAVADGRRERVGNGVLLAQRAGEGGLHVVHRAVIVAREIILGPRLGGIFERGGGGGDGAIDGPPFQAGADGAVEILDVEILAGGVGRNSYIVRGGIHPGRRGERGTAQLQDADVGGGRGGDGELNGQVDRRRLGEDDAHTRIVGAGGLFGEVVDAVHADHGHVGLLADLDVEDEVFAVVGHVLVFEVDDNLGGAGQLEGVVEGGGGEVRIARDGAIAARIERETALFFHHPSVLELVGAGGRTVGRHVGDADGESAGGVLRHRTSKGFAVFGNLEAAHLDLLDGGLGVERGQLEGLGFIAGHDLGGVVLIGGEHHRVAQSNTLGAAAVEDVEFAQVGLAFAVQDGHTHRGGVGGENLAFATDLGVVDGIRQGGVGHEEGVDGGARGVGVGEAHAHGDGGGVAFGHGAGGLPDAGVVHQVGLALRRGRHGEAESEDGALDVARGSNHAEHRRVGAGRELEGRERSAVGGAHEHAGHAIALPGAGKFRPVGLGGILLVFNGVAGGIGQVLEVVGDLDFEGAVDVADAAHGQRVGRKHRGLRHETHRQRGGHLVIASGGDVIAGSLFLHGDIEIDRVEGGGGVGGVAAHAEEIDGLGEAGIIALLQGEGIRRERVPAAAVVVVGDMHIVIDVGGGGEAGSQRNHQIVRLGGGQRLADVERDGADGVFVVGAHGDAGGAGERDVGDQRIAHDDFNFNIVGHIAGSLLEEAVGIFAQVELDRLALLPGLALHLELVIALAGDNRNFTHLDTGQEAGARRRLGHGSDGFDGGDVVAGHHLGNGVVARPDVELGGGGRIARHGNGGDGGAGGGALVDHTPILGALVDGRLIGKTDGLGVEATFVGIPVVAVGNEPIRLAQRIGLGNQRTTSKLERGDLDGRIAHLGDFPQIAMEPIDTGGATGRSAFEVGREADGERDIARLNLVFEDEVGIERIASGEGGLDILGDAGLAVDHNTHASRGGNGVGGLGAQADVVELPVVGGATVGGVKLRVEQADHEANRVAALQRAGFAGHRFGLGRTVRVAGTDFVDGRRQSSRGHIGPSRNRQCRNEEFHHLHGADPLL